MSLCGYVTRLGRDKAQCEQEIGRDVTRKRITVMVGDDHLLTFIGVRLSDPLFTFVQIGQSFLV
jgi:hypothetical protein